MWGIKIISGNYNPFEFIIKRLVFVYLFIKTSKAVWFIILFFLAKQNSSIMTCMHIESQRVSQLVMTLKRPTQKTAYLGYIGFFD